MTFRQLFKSALFRFSELKGARKTPFWKIVLYLLILSIILAIPYATQSMKVYRSVESDAQDIGQKLPDFTIKDGQLETEADGFIYQTDSIIFTFDPAGTRTKEDIANDMVGNYFSIGLLKNKAVIAFSSAQDISSILFGSNTLSLPYSSDTLAGLTGKNLRELISSLTVSNWIWFLLLFVAIYPSLLDLLITLLIISFFANLFAKFRLIKTTFFETLKMMTVLSFVPVVIASVIAVFRPQFSASTLIALFDVFFFFQAAKHLDRYQLPPQE